MDFKKQTICPPDGYEVDEERSTFKEIIFKPISASRPHIEVPRGYEVEELGDNHYRIIPKREEKDDNKWIYRKPSSLRIVKDYGLYPYRVEAFYEDHWMFETCEETREKAEEYIRDFEKIKAKEIEDYERMKKEQLHSMFEEVLFQKKL